MNPWPKSKVLRVLAALWSAPTAAVGLFIVIGWPMVLAALLRLSWPWALGVAAAWVVLTLWVPVPRNGAIFFRSHGPLGWVFRRGDWAAVTFAWVSLAWDEVLPGMVVHETTHTRQALELGPFFLPAWACWTVCRGYRKNPLEVEAYAVQGDLEA